MKTTGVSGDYTTSTTYDLLDRQSTSTISDGTSGDDRVVHYCYDLDGDLRTTTRPQGQRVVHRLPHDPEQRGELHPVYGVVHDTVRLRQRAPADRDEGPARRGTHTTYDPNGAVLSTTDENGNETDYTYNDRGDKVTRSSRSTGPAR